MDRVLTQKEKAELFDRSMLKVLMIEFMRDTNVPFAFIDNPKLRTLLNFMRPDLELPSCSDLMQLNIDEVDTFLLWDRTIRYASAGTLEQQNEALISVNNDRVRLVKRDAKIFDDETEMAPILYDSQYATVDEIDPSAGEFRVKDEPLDDCQDQNTEIQTGVGKEQKPELFHNTSLKRPALPETVKEEDSGPLKAPRIAEEDRLFDPALSSIPLASTGLGRYPCLICQEKVEPYKLRALNVSDGFLIIYMNIMDGVYDMERAKQIARNPQFKICVEHLPSLIGNASHHFEVVDPEIDIYEGNQSILNAFKYVNELRCAKYINDPWYTGYRKNPLPFCASIKAFFTRYRRETYLQK